MRARDWLEAAVGPVTMLVTCLILASCSEPASKEEGAAPEQVWHKGRLYKRIPTDADRGAEWRTVRIVRVGDDSIRVDGDPLPYWLAGKCSYRIGDRPASLEQVRYLVNGRRIIDEKLVLSADVRIEPYHYRMVTELWLEAP